MAPFLWLILSLFGPQPDDTPGGPMVQTAAVTLHLAEIGTHGVNDTFTV